MVACQPGQDILKAIGLLGFPLGVMVVLFFVLRYRHREGLAENVEEENDDCTD